MGEFKSFLEEDDPILQPFRLFLLLLDYLSELGLFVLADVELLLEFPYLPHLLLLVDDNFLDRVGLAGPPSNYPPIQYFAL